MGGILDGFIQPIKPPGLEGHLPEFQQAYLAPHKGVAGVCNSPLPIAIEPPHANLRSSFGLFEQPNFKP